MTKDKIIEYAHELYLLWRTDSNNKKRINELKNKIKLFGYTIKTTPNGYYLETKKCKLCGHKESDFHSYSYSNLPFKNEYEELV